MLLARGDEVRPLLDQGLQRPRHEELEICFTAAIVDDGEAVLAKAGEAHAVEMMPRLPSACSAPFCTQETTFDV